METSGMSDTMSDERSTAAGFIACGGAVCYSASSSVSFISSHSSKDCLECGLHCPNH